MEIWYVVVIVLHVLVALAIIGLVLLQHGKGADMGSGFGGGASASLFGATGSANFLSRTTAVLATLFFLLSLGLAYFARHWSGWVVGLLIALAVFAFYEAARGWCVMRACGIKTKL